MADGTYERRGPREAELKRFARLLAERRATAVSAVASTTKSDVVTSSQASDRG